MIGEENREVVRVIINQWLAKTTTTKRGLAKAAQIGHESIIRFLNGKQKTIQSDILLKIFSAIYKELSPEQRSEFIHAAGIKAEANAFSDLALGAAFIESDLSLGFHEKGIRLYAIGKEVGRKHWRDAIPILQRAEALLKQSLSSEAARAAIQIASLQILIGHYDVATATLKRIESEYLIRDAGTELELFRFKGIAAFYLGNLNEARNWYLNYLKMAKKLDYRPLTSFVYHFLGKVEKGAAQLTSNLAEKKRLNRLSESYFDTSEQIDKEINPGLDNPFNHFRKAQVLNRSGNADDAKKLRKKSREMLARTNEVLHIDVEEANISVHRGENIRTSVNKAYNALEVRSEMGYAAGMALALDVLSMANYIDGDLYKAFEYSVISLCVIPNEASIVKKKVWDFMEEYLKPLLIDGVGNIQAYRLYLCNLYEMALLRRGDFEFISTSNNAQNNKIIKGVFRRLGLPSEQLLEEVMGEPALILN